MPPPPAAPLPSWQVETLARWFKDPRWADARGRPRIWPCDRARSEAS